MVVDNGDTVVIRGVMLLRIESVPTVEEEVNQVVHK